MKKTLYLLGFAAAFAGGALIGSHAGAGGGGSEERIVRCDTLFVRDTVTVASPAVSAQRSAGRLALVVPADSVAVDTLAAADSLSISLPRVVRRYDGEDYAAIVSGVEPRLDSLIIYKEWPQVTRTISRAATKRSRWSIGLSGGVAATPRGVQPYIGVGVSYSLFTF